MRGKKILLVITGSIAAYKAAFFTRLLIKAGAEVQVIMTEAATEFISPLTLSTLSKRPVLTKIFAEGEWNSHVELGLWADVMLIAPATANTMARMANGVCDNLSTAVYLSARCPVYFAPAMDLDMWKHPATQANVERLKSFGNKFIEVGHGELASGLIGEGRMAEPEDIIRVLEKELATGGVFSNKKILVTAGPTYEPLDPIRFIGNHSSGKMGVAIADAFAAQGAHVSLILGPSKVLPEHAGIKVVKVQTAQEMFDAAISLFLDTEVAVLAAAVADYRPASVSIEKIKKKEKDLTLQLEKTPDIAAELGRIKSAHQVIVGFALETENEIENAINKLQRKNFDCIVLNSLREAGAGFNHDTNKITILYPGNKRKDFELKSKKELASDIVAEVNEILFSRGLR